jgi:hypothetical protein
MKPASTPDGGFSIIEVLVALALCSLVVMGIGGLVSLAVQARSSVDETAKVQVALVDLQAILLLTGEATNLAVVKPTAEGFDLVIPKVGAASEISRRVELSASDGRLELTRGDRIAIADLSVFDSAALEYLALDPDPAWMSGDALMQSMPVGARLRLELKDRVWRPLVWMISPFEVVPLGVRDLS